MAWPHSIMQVLTYGSERSNGLIPPPCDPPALPSDASNLHGKSYSARDALQSQLRVILGLVFALQVLLSPSQHYIIYILQARDSSTEMQHTHKTTQHTFSTTWNNLNIISLFLFFSKQKKKTLNGHRNILIGGNIYNIKHLD